MDALKDLVKKTLYCAGYYRFWSAIHAPAENRLVIIMYHDLVEDGIAERDWRHAGKHSRSQFAAQVRFLADHYRVLTVEEAVEEMVSAGCLTRPTVAITFDDGYVSVYTIAWPILRDLGLSATVYLPSDWIGERKIPWWMVVGEAVGHCVQGAMGLAEIARAVGVPMEKDLPPLKSDGDAGRLYARIVAHLRTVPAEQIEAAVTELSALLMPLLDDRHAPPVFLSWDQVHELASAGLRFGAHTHTHRNLSFLDPSAAEAEIRKSRDACAAHLNAPVAGFAYPYGADVAKYGTIRPLLKEHGFSYAVTAVSGVNTHTTDRYLLRRITLPLSTSTAIIDRTLRLSFIGDRD